MCLNTVTYNKCTCGRTWNKVDALEYCEEASKEKSEACKKGVELKDEPTEVICAICLQNLNKKHVGFSDDVEQIPSPDSGCVAY